MFDLPLRENRRTTQKNEFPSSLQNHNTTQTFSLKQLLRIVQYSGRGLAVSNHSSALSKTKNQDALADS